MVGVKLWVARKATAAELDPVIARATELKAPILQHTWFKAGGNLPGDMRLTFLVCVAAMALLFTTLWKLELTNKHTAEQLRRLRRRLEAQV